MSLELRTQAFAQAVGADIKAILGSIGVLANLNTTDKSNLVNAINEVLAASGVGGLLAANNLSDVANATTARTNLDVLSSSEITAAIAAVTLGSLGGLTQAEVDARVQLVVDSAPAALDTLNEIAAALGDDANFAGTVTAALANKVGFDAPQALTTPQQLQACQNIGVGDPEFDIAAAYVTARDS